jgi:hypothetical protein
VSARVEYDDWGPGASILASEVLVALRGALEETPLIVEHRLYRGASSPVRLIFDDFGRLDEYLRTQTRIGDSVWVWRYDALCRDDNSLVQGKIPDSRGFVPKGGAY